MEKQELSHILVILAGLLRAVGIACMIALIFVGARLRYIFLIALLTVGGIFTTVLVSFHAYREKEPSTTKTFGNHKVRGVFCVHKDKPGVFRAEVW